MRTDTGKNIIQLSAFVIAVGLAVCFSVCFAVQVCAANVRTIKLDDRINPNDAPVASMARLPGLGAVRAQAIVAYREDSALNNGGKPAFEDCNDLQQVKGIGPKTVKNINPWLEFE